MPNTYSPASAAFRRIVKDAARAAIAEWLQSLPQSGRYRFEVNGVECIVEYHEGHWGFVGEGRWRWGRVDAGDPDEDQSGEDMLLDVALGLALLSEPPCGPRRRSLPVLAGPDDGLTRAEIRAKTAALARANLDKLALHRLPPI